MARPAAGTAKRFHRGTHRLVPPAVTVERLQPLLRSMGIRRVANVTGLDRIGIPVVMVVRPGSRSLSVSQGKGLDLDSAKASGLMESIELFHAEHIDLPLKWATLREVRSKYETLDLQRISRTGFSQFHDDLRMHWIESRDLSSGTPIWVPYEMVHLNLTLPLPPGSGCFALSSNGLASGNHPLEAYSHALCELIERDAHARWLYTSKARRQDMRLDLASIQDPDCLWLLERFEGAGIYVAIWDITSDLRVPTFRAYILNAEISRGMPLPGAEGFGCHPDRRIALSRALTEAAQDRLTMISGSRDDLERERYEDQLDPDSLERLLADLKQNPGQHTFEQSPSRELNLLEEEVSYLLDCLIESGFQQILGVDLSRSEFGIPVIKVIVPGLEGFPLQPGYRPGARVHELFRRQGRYQQSHQPSSSQPLGSAGE